MSLFGKKNNEKQSEQTISDTAKEILSRVKFPHQVFPAGESAEMVNEEYRKACIRGKQEGFVPILVVADATLAEWLGILDEDSYSVEAILGEEHADGKKILEQNYSMYESDYQSDFMEDGKSMEDTMREFMGEMQEGETLDYLSSIESFSQDGIEETILFEIPVKNPWEVIAWMPMGGWNECPDASDMMAVSRYWYEKYGAIPAAFSHDTLEYVLEKPVGEEAAWEVAKEHWAFCPDRVDQCTATGTLGEVADCLRKSSVWYFWWD